MLSREEILQEIKRRVLALEPEAEVWLYGSRARGDYNDNSDWDLIVIVPRELNYKQKQKIHYTIYDFGMEIGELFSIFIHTRKQWEKYKFIPFRQEVEKEKIVL